ncbi:MAG: pyruvate formate lyase family protein [Lentisphaeria bacterium]
MMNEKFVFDSASGLSPEKIEAKFRCHCAENPDEPYILSHAYLMNLICTEARICPEPNHLFAGLVEHGNLFERLFYERRKTEWEKEFHGLELLGRLDFERGIHFMVDASHVSPDWQAVLELGLPGLRSRAAKAGGTPFHRACVLVYDGAIRLSERLGKASHNKALLAIAKRPPETLHEAFQLTYFLHELIENGKASVRSMGRFDRDFIRFYRHDLAAGLLTRDGAKELLKHYWMRFYTKHQGKLFGKNFCFGPDINELSYLGMETYYEMNVVDPKLSVFLRENTPYDFIELCMKSIRDGRTAIVSLNYDMIIKSMLKAGRAPDDVHNVVPIGCYEPAIMGKEISLSGATHLLFPCVLLHTLKYGAAYRSFEKLMAAFLADLADSAGEMATQQARCEKIWPEINPVPLLSATFAECVESGRDITEGGAKYNTTGCVASYIADCVDSLAAIRELVYRRKICSLSVLKKALAADWKGYEKLNFLARTTCPKWGNNDQQADDIALRVINYSAKVLNNLPNGRGGKITPSIYGQAVVERGREIGALPSGRYAGEPMSKNMDAVIAMDKNGVTALMESVLKVDMTDWPCGTCLDLMLHPTSVQGAEGIGILVSLIRTFIRRGGSGLQFNIFDANVLRDAQAHPKRYETLQVRVCGWNVRFNDLDKDAQETFIRQADASAS